MNIHEYQAREILRAHGVPVPPGEIATTPEEAERIAAQYGGMVVVKAQVHAGGRGKAGGVKLAVDPADAREKAGAILGIEIKGLTVEKVLVAPAEDIETEAYLGIVMDRGSQSDVIMVSSEGGIDIEEVAATNPDAIQKLAVDARYGLLPHQASALAHGLYSDAKLARQASRIIMQLYDAYRAAGCTLAEINPLITTPGGEVKAIDAKMNIDDNALFRLPDVAAMRDEAAEDPAERKAREAGLSYIQLDGDVGCCVNGAGLAMATMDAITLHGGSPANFLDVGGGASKEKVTAAFKIILSGEHVEAILVNIFGGIVRCDLIAQGIIAAVEEVGVSVPVVVRLEGTLVDEGRKLLSDSGLAIISASDLNDAAKKAVAAANNSGVAQ